MLDMTQKRVGHGGKEKWEMEEGGGEMGKYRPTWTASDRVSD